MSFATSEEILSLIEMILAKVWKKELNVDLKLPFQRMAYKEAINKVDKAFRDNFIILIFSMGQINLILELIYLFINAQYLILSSKLVIIKSSKCY